MHFLVELLCKYSNDSEVKTNYFQSLRVLKVQPDKLVSLESTDKMDVSALVVTQALDSLVCLESVVILV